MVIEYSILIIFGFRIIELIIIYDFVDMFVCGNVVVEKIDEYESKGNSEDSYIEKVVEKNFKIFEVCLY